MEESTEILGGETTDMMDEAIAAAYIAARKRLDVEHHDRLDSALHIVTARGVTLEADGTATVKGQDEDYYFIHREDGCNCKDATVGKAPKGYCKHLLAAALEKRARQRLQATAERVLEPKASGVPSQFVVSLHGKDFVTFSGLLALAHERGLKSLAARLVSVTSELATAEATATFEDGRSFSECADATPGNVRKTIVPHFPRMALTRAKARCLRDALNIAMVAVEELGDHVESEPHIGRAREPFKPHVENGMWREQ